MSYAYLIAAVILFTFVSSWARRRFLKPLDRSQANAELEEKLREIHRRR